MATNPRSSSAPTQFTHQLSTILGTENYLVWKSQVLHVLRGHGLTSFIDGSAIPPSATISSSDGIVSPNPAFEHWYQQGQLILAWLFTSISSPILAQVLNCDTSHKLWQELQKSHISLSLAKML
jgi:hypothetical protein